MYLITLKQGTGIEESEFILDKPISFTEANRMLMDAVLKYKTSGKDMTLKYRILDMETGEILFNSKFNLTQNLESLYFIIRNNKSAPKSVIDYVSKIENGQIQEDKSFEHLNHLSEEQSIELEKLQTEKQVIQQDVKIQEKESQQREIEYQQSLKSLQDETDKIQIELQQKKQEEHEKEVERLAKLEELEEKKRQAEKIAEMKRLEDKKRKEEHEERLKVLENEMSEAEYNLECTKNEIQKKAAERQAQLKELEENKKAAERQKELSLAEEQKNNAEFELKKMDLEHSNDEKDVSFSDKPSSPVLNIPFNKNSIDFTVLLSKGTKILKTTKSFIGATVKERRDMQKEKQSMKLQVEKAKLDFLEELRKEKQKEGVSTSRFEKMHQKERGQYSHSYYKRRIIKWLINLLGLGILFIVGKIIYDLYLVEYVTYSSFVEMIKTIVEWILDIIHFIKNIIDSKT